MAVKSKADLEAENAELRERVASITAERDGFSARVVILEAEAASFKATLETVSTGHFESDRRLKALAASQTEFHDTTRATIASVRWRHSSGRPASAHGPSMPTPLPAPAGHRHQQHHHLQPPPGHRHERSHGPCLKEGRCATNSITSPNPTLLLASSSCTPQTTSPLIRRLPRSQRP